MHFFFLKKNICSDRYEVGESTTKKPNTQSDDFYNEFGNAGPSGPVGAK